MATGFEQDTQRIQKRIADALEWIADSLDGGGKHLVMDGKALAEQVVKEMPRVLADRRKSTTPPQGLTEDQLILIKKCKRRVHMGSVWHRKMGIAGTLIVEVVGRGVTHAILKHRDSSRESRSRYDYFAVNIPGCHGQYQKGEPTT